MNILVVVGTLSAREDAVVMRSKQMWDSGVPISFFFQAEDGIRDVAVTGVQTCALPISSPRLLAKVGRVRARRSHRRPLRAGSRGTDGALRLGSRTPGEAG